MNIRSVNHYVPRSDVQNAAATIESRVQKFGDAVVDTLAVGAGVAVGTVSSGAQLGVKAVGKLIDTWI
ncbi:hypothetical protein Q9Q94_12520 [Uliginosibacterium sp. 31-16]|uniref:hypothetical protein n=1 Tax=Uliginosibacterium sp. 31-16 TaxID=3068315 RepID=UPI00273F563E|nr:hypothetical protein [Uliginosibacterium sp. 31-16]MDP5240359.1 hypothetical protein [Uliginosibacterium sp. 31-16]